MLLGSRKARAEVEKSKIRQGIQQPAATRNSGFQLLQSLVAAKASFHVPWLQAADLLNHSFIIMQTPFMAEVLLRDAVQSWQAEGLEAETARHGIITDGSHDFFSHGVLLTSLVFSQVLLRWVPVLLTWIGNMDTHHHQTHFKTLIEGIADACAQAMGVMFDERMCAAVCYSSQIILMSIQLITHADYGLFPCPKEWIRRGLH